MEVTRLPLRSLFVRLFLSTAVIVLIGSVLVSGWSQEAQPSQAPPPAASSSQAEQQPSQLASPPPTKDVPGAGLAVQDQSQIAPQTPPPAQPPAKREAQPTITKKEAKELFRSVDQILRFASNDTALPIKHKVKRKLITRQAVEQYVDKRIKDDKDAQRLERSEAVLKKFGLLPANYDMHAQFLRLLGEQVAAYYDAKTRSVNLLDWVQPDAQKPVLAHELTHALQDQKIGLEMWELAGAKDDRPQPDQQEQVVEEAQAARQAVTEGQAMLVLMDYSLAPLGKNVVTAPEMVNAMRSGMGSNDDSPVFAAAPIFLRESMLMPYTFGLDFVRTVLVKKGKEAAFGGMLEHPPIDTRQIMEPETYLASQVVEPLKVPDLDGLVAPNYERYDFGEMGEFDVYLLARQYAPKDDSKNIYPHWRGGYYFATHSKSAPKTQIALLYLSRWDSPESADAFSKLYTEYLPQRYPEARAPEATKQSASSAADAGSGPQTYANGRVSVERRGTDLLIMEDLDEATRQHVRDALLPASPPSSTTAGTRLR